MNRETLEKRVALRADNRVQARIQAFRKDIDNACHRLLGEAYFNNHAARKRVLEIMLTREHPAKWPKLLWEKEEETVMGEVLATMNELQKVLLAKPVENREEPADE